MGFGGARASDASDRFGHRSGGSATAAELLSGRRSPSHPGAQATTGPAAGGRAPVLSDGRVRCRGLCHGCERDGNRYPRRKRDSRPIDSGGRWVPRRGPHTITAVSTPGTRRKCDSSSGAASIPYSSGATMAGRGFACWATRERRSCPISPLGAGRGSTLRTQAWQSSEDPAVCPSIGERTGSRTPPAPSKLRRGTGVTGGLSVLDRTWHRPWRVHRCRHDPVRLWLPPQPLCLPSRPQGRVRYRRRGVRGRGLR